MTDDDINNLNSATVVEPLGVGFAIDTTTHDHPVVGLEIVGRKDEHFIIALDADTARDVASWLLSHALVLQGKSNSVVARSAAVMGGK